jgi:hypothetical protein
MAEESTFGKIFGDLSLGGLLGTIISGAGYKNQLDRLGSFGQRAQTGAEAIGQESCCRYSVCSLYCHRRDRRGCRYYCRWKHTVYFVT